MRRLEARLGRVGALVAGYGGGFLLLTLICSVLLGIADSNLIWGEDNQYGRVGIPGTKVVHLPAGSVNATAAVALPGRGNETPSLLLPNGMNLAVVPLQGGGRPKIRLDVGASVNADDKQDDTQRRVWRIDVPHAGQYRVTTEGDFTGYGVNAQVWLGHEPGFLGEDNAWVVGAIVALAIVLLLALVAGTRGRRPEASGLS